MKTIGWTPRNPNKSYFGPSNLQPVHWSTDAGGGNWGPNFSSPNKLPRLLKAPSVRALMLEIPDPKKILTFLRILPNDYWLYILITFILVVETLEPRNPRHKLLLANLSPGQNFKYIDDLQLLCFTANTKITKESFRWKWPHKVRRGSLSRKNWGVGVVVVDRKSDRAGETGSYQVNTNANLTTSWDFLRLLTLPRLGGGVNVTHTCLSHYGVI